MTISLIMQAADELSDMQLLDRFLTDRDQSAFTVIVQRHGPMVFGVCRRTLGNAADADDAFQAVFVVLARNANSIRRSSSLGSWLHGVALRTSRKAKTMSARRREREREAHTLRESSSDAVLWDDLRPILDEELDRLDEKYRAPIVLCYLEGKSYEEAAKQLGCPSGTVSGRLDRARKMLRDRLARRGVDLTATALVALLAQNARAAVPPELVVATVQNALTPAASTLVLSDGIVQPFVTWKLKFVTMSVLIAGIGGGVFFWQSKTEPAVAQQLKLEPRSQRINAGHAVQSIAIEPNGRRFVTAGGNDLFVWDRGMLEKIDTLKGHTAEIAVVVYSPNGSLLASAGHDRTIRLWDMKERKLKQTLPEQTASILTLCFSFDGRWLVSGSEDGELALWDVATGRLVSSWEAQRGRVWSVAFAPDGKSIAVAGSERNVRIWSIPTIKSQNTIRTSGSVYAIAFSADGQQIVTSEANTIVIRNASTGAEQSRLTAESSEVAWFTIAPDGHSIAWGGNDRSIHLWELASGGERLTLDGSQPATSLAFMPGGKGLITGESEGHLTLWDLDQVPGSDSATAMEMLDDPDAKSAYRAMLSLSHRPEEAVKFLRQRLRAEQNFNDALASLIVELDHNRYAIRERAMRDLIGMGRDALPTILEALKNDPSPEVRQRLDRIVERIEQSSQAISVSQARALECLERIGTPNARQTLEMLAGRGSHSAIAHEARLALMRMARE